MPTTINTTPSTVIVASSSRPPVLRPMRRRPRRTPATLAHPMQLRNGVPIAQHPTMRAPWPLPHRALSSTAQWSSFPAYAHLDILAHGHVLSTKEVRCGLAAFLLIVE